MKLIQEVINCRTCGQLVMIKEGYSARNLETIYNDPCTCQTNSYETETYTNGN